MSCASRWSKYHLTCWRGLKALALIFTLAIGSATVAQDRTAFLRLVREIMTAEYGVPSPNGLAFSPAANVFLLLEAGKTDSAGNAAIVLVTPFEALAGSVSVATTITDPLNTAFDAHGNRLVFFDQATNELVAFLAGPDGYPEKAEKAITRWEVWQWGVRQAQGLTFDRKGGRLFILDAAAQRIVSITPDAAGGLDGVAAVRDGRVRQIDLKALGDVALRGLAYNPSNGHLYTISLAEQTGYEFTETGQLVSMLDLAPLQLNDTQAMVFAPSGDPTDDAAIMNLYVVGSGLSTGHEPGHRHIFELSLTAPVLVALPASIQASLVHTTLTSQWDPPSPDPSGIAYQPATGRLVIGDGEVDEMPRYFVGMNVFEMTTGGDLQAMCGTTAFSNEPVGVAVNPANGHIFFSDDDQDKFFEVALGTDGIYCTSDDIVTTINTPAFGSMDPEGLAYGLGNLFIADGLGAEVYRVAPGANGIFDGVPPAGDDVVTHWDTASLGQPDPEGIEYNPDRNTLYIVSNGSSQVAETTTGGTVVNVIDISAANPDSAAGLAYGPGSVNPGVKNVYVADRRVDNCTDPNENDGMIYEFTGLPGATPTATATSSSAHTSTPTNTPTPSHTPTAGPSPTASNTSDPTATATDSPTPSQTPTPTPTPSRTPTPSQTPTVTHTLAPAASATPTPSQTPMATHTLTPTPSRTPTQTATASATRTPTPSQTPAPTATPTLTPSRTPTPTATPSRTPTATRTPTAKTTATATHTPRRTSTPPEAPPLLLKTYLPLIHNSPPLGVVVLHIADPARRDTTSLNTRSQDVCSHLLILRSRVPSHRFSGRPGCGPRSFEPRSANFRMV